MNWSKFKQFWQEFKQIAPWAGWHQLLIWIIALLVIAWITAPFWIWHFIEPSGYIDYDWPCEPNYMGGCD